MKTSAHSQIAILAMLALLGGGSAVHAQAAPPQAGAPASMAGCSDDIRHNATREQISFESRGHTVPALIYKPRVSNGAGVVLLHGFMGLQGHAPTFDPHAIQMASRGYTVLVPSYFDARPWRQRFNGQDIRAWTETGADSVRFLGTLPGIDPAKVGLWGYSLGGYLAADGSMAEGSTAALAVGVSAGTAIYDNPSRGNRSIPILMIHGRADPSVSVSSMQTLASNLRLRGATVETEIVESNDHAMDGPTWCKVFQMSRQFMDAHLLPARAAPAE